MESKIFDVEAAGLTLQFEFYTFDSIQEDLKFVKIKIKTGKLNFLLILNSLLKKRQIKHMVLLAEKLIIIVLIFRYMMRKKMSVDLGVYS